MQKKTRLTKDKLPSGLPDEDKEKLIQVARTFEEEPELNHTGPNVVDEQLCELMTEAYENGDSLRDIVEYTPVSSSSTVHRHVTGECKHTKRVEISYDECGWMRFHASKGAPSKTLAVLYNVSKQVAVRHIAGHCSHQHGLPPVSGHDLKNNSRSKKPLVSSVCAWCGEEFKHRDCEDRVTCSYKCSGKYTRSEHTVDVASDD